MGPEWNRLEMNRKMLAFMGKINILPWKFSRHDQFVEQRQSTSKLRWGIWISTFALAVVYTVYIDMALLHTVFTQLNHMERYDQFGLHMLRALVATTFSYWAYQLFVAHPEEHVILYNWTQPHPGKPLEH